MKAREIRKLWMTELRNQGNIVAHEIQLFGSIADIGSIDKQGYLTEYEIKVSYDDFKADFKKTNSFSLQNKHRCMATRAQGSTYERYNRQFTVHIPNYFTFLAPRGVIPHNEIPEYCGFIEFSYDALGRETYEIIKRRKRLHDQPHGDAPGVHLAFMRRLTNICVSSL